MFSMASFPARWLLIVCGIAGLAALFAWASTRVLGLAAAAFAFTLAALLEVLHLALARRRSQLSKLWPQVFDSCYSAQAAGVPLDQQIFELSESGPDRLRPGFLQLQRDLELLAPLEALRNFQARHASREADLFATLLALNHELGGRGQQSAWRDAGSHLRESLKLTSEIVTKQGWVVGSAKLALVAPWLIVTVLMQLGDNRLAFASASGTLILLFGLVMSGLGYFLVSLLGRLPEQPRVLYAR
jgi:tight adherence protein B